ncbi:MAG TPA: metallophosphoesterase [Planctomycetaceae bacterium]|nr:metallophosphoesterase [Planctomycetaceae bacterium]
MQHYTWFPSDHAAVVSQFERLPSSHPALAQTQRLRTVAYNIRHAVGMDKKLSVMRTAKRLHDLQPDVVGLAEVDVHCNRSGNVNQAAVLGNALKMHSAFGKFMDYDGGQYGMAVLSKYPIIDVHTLELPPGGEPRIALMAEVLLPSDERILVVNVHFDWLRNDEIRFQQATKLRDYLRQVSMPVVLLGDFNDQPGSRTLRLFEELLEADKPESERFTWSATEPKVEIDFIFAAPRERWSARGTRVVDESVVSDHRPVLTELTLKP